MKKILSLGVLCGLISCASWRAGNTPLSAELTAEQTKSIVKPHVSLTFKQYEVYSNGKLQPGDMTEDDKAQVQKHIELSYKDSPLFTLVDNDSPNKDMSIEVSVARRFKSNITMTVLNVVTLFMIPRKTTEEVIVTTRFLDKEGILVGMVEKSDEVIVWHQFFMLFAMPFSLQSGVLDELYVDLNKASLLEAHNDGYFIDIND